MHISEGVLSAPVLAAGAALAAGGVAMGLRKMDYARVPKVAVMSSAFFVASFIHIPIGPANVHLTLNGLVGFLLGWMAFPSMLVALALQALMFQFGGFTTLGVNICIMAFPAVLVHYVFSEFLRSERGKEFYFLAGFGAGVTSTALSIVLTALSLILTGREFTGIAAFFSIAHLPALVVEGLITAFAVLFLLRVKPEMLTGTRASYESIEERRFS